MPDLIAFSPLELVHGVAKAGVSAHALDYEKCRRVALAIHGKEAAERVVKVISETLSGVFGSECSIAQYRKRLGNASVTKDDRLGLLSIFSQLCALNSKSSEANRFIEYVLSSHFTEESDDRIRAKCTEVLRVFLIRLINEFEEERDGKFALSCDGAKILVSVLNCNRQCANGFINEVEACLPREDFAKTAREYFSSHSSALIAKVTASHQIHADLFLNSLLNATVATDPFALDYKVISVIDAEIATVFVTGFTSYVLKKLREETPNPYSVLLASNDRVGLCVLVGLEEFLGEEYYEKFIALQRLYAYANKDETDIETAELRAQLHATLSARPNFSRVVTSILALETQPDRSVFIRGGCKILAPFFTYEKGKLAPRTEPVQTLGSEVATRVAHSAASYQSAIQTALRIAPEYNFGGITAFSYSNIERFCKSSFEGRLISILVLLSDNYKHAESYRPYDFNQLHGLFVDLVNKSTGRIFRDLIDPRFSPHMASDDRSRLAAKMKEAFDSSSEDLSLGNFLRFQVLAQRADMQARSRQISLDHGLVTAYFDFLASEKYAAVALRLYNLVSVADVGELQRMSRVQGFGYAVNLLLPQGLTSPLHSAASVDTNGGLTQALLEFQPRPNLDVVNAEDETALHLAVWWGKFGAAKALIDGGANLQLRNRGLTPLQLAAKKGHSEILNYILEVYAKQDYSAMFHEVERAFVLAAKNNHYAIAASLVVNFDVIDVNQTYQITDSDGQIVDDMTLLHYLVSKSNVSKAIIELLIEQEFSLTALDSLGRTPIMVAAQEGCDEAFGALLEAMKVRGLLPDPNLFNPNLDLGDGSRYIHLAVCKNNYKMVDLLIKCGATVGRASLGMAVHRGSPMVARVLLEAGANPNFAFEARPLIFDAIARGDEEVLSALLNHGGAHQIIDINVRINDETPLVYAIERRMPGMVSILLDAGADPNLPFSRDQLSALHMAARKGENEIIRLLIMGGVNAQGIPHGNGAQIEAKDDYGQTALHVAAAYGRGSTVELLINAGADIEAIDKIGKTPLYHAFYHKNLPATLSLIASGADLTKEYGYRQSCAYTGLTLLDLSLTEAILKRFRIDNYELAERIAFQVAIYRDVPAINDEHEQCFARFYQAGGFEFMFKVGLVSVATEDNADENRDLKRFLLAYGASNDNWKLPDEVVKKAVCSTRIDGLNLLQRAALAGVLADDPDEAILAVNHAIEYGCGAERLTSELAGDKANKNVFTLIFDIAAEVVAGLANTIELLQKTKGRETQLRDESQKVMRFLRNVTKIVSAISQAHDKKRGGDMPTAKSLIDRVSESRANFDQACKRSGILAIMPPSEAVIALEAAPLELKSRVAQR